MEKRSDVLSSMQVDDPKDTNYDTIVSLPNEASREKSDKDTGCISEADAGDAETIVNVNPVKPEKKELRQFWLARIENLQNDELEAGNNAGERKENDEEDDKSNGGSSSDVGFPKGKVPSPPWRKASSFRKEGQPDPREERDEEQR
ncbi:MAG: hypothetical protein Q9204_006345 [Flavoplaca sp. TL-2023a]